MIWGSSLPRTDTQPDEFLQPQRSRQIFEQRLRFLQITGAEPLGEPAVDGGEEGSSLVRESSLFRQAGLTQRAEEPPRLIRVLVWKRPRYNFQGIFWCDLFYC